MSSPAVEAVCSSLAGLGFDIPSLPSTYSLNEYHTNRGTSSGSGSRSARSEPTPLPSPSTEQIVYPRHPRVESTKSTEQVSDSSTGLDALLEDTHSLFNNFEETEDIHEHGYEAGCEGEHDTKKRHYGRKRKHHRAARVAGVALTAPKYKRARTYVNSGIGKGLPGGVSPHNRRRAAYTVAIPQGKCAQAYAGLGIGLPGGVSPHSQRSTACIWPTVDITHSRRTQRVTGPRPLPRPPLNRETWPCAPSPSLLPSPHFSSPISLPKYPTTYIRFPVAPSPSMLPTPFPAYRTHVRGTPQTPSRPLRPSAYPIQRPPIPPRRPLAQIGLGIVGVNIPIAPTPVPELAYDFI